MVLGWREARGLWDGLREREQTDRNVKSTDPKMTAESTAVQAHLAMMQDVITRMADNSRSCKLWCVTLVSAMLVLMSRSDEWWYALVALVPTLFLGVLDIYYLSLEQRFRNSYNNFVTRLHQGTLDRSGVFVIAPSGSRLTYGWRSAKSWAIWPFYLGVGAVVFIVAGLARG